MKITVKLADREPLIIDTRPIDNVRFEDTARKHKWGTIQEAPMRYMYFLAYAACTRTGNYESSRGFDTFMVDLVDVDAEVDAEVADAPDPLEDGAV